MDKKALLAIILSLMVLLAWSYFFAPHPQPQATKSAAAARPADVTPSSEQGSARETTGGQNEPSLRNEAQGQAKERREASSEERTTVETDFTRAIFTNRGARIVSWSLKKYTDDAGKPYELVSPACALAQPPTYPMDLHTPDEDMNRALGNALFESAREADAGEGQSVRFFWSDGKGLEAEKTISFRNGSYTCDVSASVKKDGRPVEVDVVWGPGIGTSLLAGRTSSFDYIGRAVIGSESAVQRIPPQRLTAAQQIQGGVTWAGIEEQYFSAFFLPEQGENSLSRVRLEPFQILPAPGGKDEPHLAVMVAADRPVRLYGGPKEYDRLKTVGYGTDRLVYFAQPAPLIGTILGPVIEPLARLLYFCLGWLHHLVPNWGVAIILLTMAIKLAFYPITQRAFVKMRRVQQDMQRIQPKVKAIKDKFRKLKGAEARQKLNQEIMDLYRREGINPMAGMSGCLPLLIQLPFLYAFYNVLTVSIELRKAPFFGWITDLTRKDPWYVTPVLMGATMFIQQRMAMTRVTDPQQRAQQRMMMVMPLMFTIFFLGLPSGLTLYWFVSNLLQIGQQVLINRQADRVLGKPGELGSDGRGETARAKSREGGSGQAARSSAVTEPPAGSPAER